MSEEVLMEKNGEWPQGEASSVGERSPEVNARCVPPRRVRSRGRMHGGGHQILQNATVRRGGRELECMLGC